MDAYSPLVGNSDNDIILHDSVQVDNLGGALTIAMLLYLENDTANQNFYHKRGGATGEDEWGIGFRGDLANDPWRFFMANNAGSYAHANANSTSFANYGLNKWLLHVARCDLAGGATGARLYCGDQFNPPAEATAYALQDNPGGSTTARTTDFLVGNNNGRVTETYCPIAWYGVWKGTLTQAEINDVWLRIMKLQADIALPPGLKLEARPGTRGAVLVEDISGYAYHGLATSMNPSDVVWPPVIDYEEYEGVDAA